MDSKPESSLKINSDSIRVEFDKKIELALLLKIKTPQIVNTGLKKKQPVNSNHVPFIRSKYRER